MLGIIPLTLIPLALYYGFDATYGGGPQAWWQEIVLTVDLISGARWNATRGDIVIFAGLFCLFIEIIKATRTGAGSIADHLVSTLVLIGHIVLFLVHAPAASSVFVILTLMALLDVMAGFSVALRTARRDVAVGPGGTI